LRFRDAFHNRADRGPQSFRIKLPGPSEGELRFVTRPLHPPDTSFAGTDRKTMYVTSRAQLKYVTLAVPGLPD
jgi:hypothetical protein